MKGTLPLQAGRLVSRSLRFAFAPPRLTFRVIGPLRHTLAEQSHPLVLGQRTVCEH